MTKPLFFGNLLRWQVVEPREISAVYNGREHTIRYARRETVRARFGSGSAGWFLDMPYGEGWEWGYPLSAYRAQARYFAELKIICPWVMPTTSGVAPSLTHTILDRGTYWKGGKIRHRHTGLIELLRREELVSSVRIGITTPADSAVAPIGVTWTVCRPGCGDVVCATWDEAYVEATR